MKVAMQVHGVCECIPTRKPSIRRGTPLPELCDAISESNNDQLARSILSPCGLTVQIGIGYFNYVSVAWCVNEYCKLVEGAEVRLMRCQFLPLSLSWETSPH